MTRLWGLMFEMAHAGDDHGEFIFHAVFDRVFVADGSTGLDEGFDAGGVSDLDAVVEGEEGIGCEYGAVEIEIKLTCLGDGLAKGVDPAGLSTAFSYELSVFYEGDSV